MVVQEVNIGDYLSKTKNKNHKEMEHILGENRKLRKEIKQLRRLIEKNPFPSQDDAEESCDSEDTHPKVYKNVKICEECGKGEITQFEIVGKVFEQCSLCDYRKKL